MTRKLHEALVCVGEAADLTIREDEMADFTRLAHGGLSANLCEALVKIGGEDGLGFSSDFTGSPTCRWSSRHTASGWPRPSSQP